MVAGIRRPARSRPQDSPRRRRSRRRPPRAPCRQRSRRAVRSLSWDDRQVVAGGCAGGSLGRGSAREAKRWKYAGSSSNALICLAATFRVLGAVGAVREPRASAAHFQHRHRPALRRRRCARRRASRSPRRRSRRGGGRAPLARGLVDPGRARATRHQPTARANPRQRCRHICPDKYCWHPCPDTRRRARGARPAKGLEKSGLLLASLVLVMSPLCFPEGDHYALPSTLILISRQALVEEHRVGDRQAFVCPRRGRS